MVAYLTKFDASEGFNQIIDFLNGCYIKYALTVNPNIYVSCIKQFWNIVAIKQVNDITRLQALVDKKKVVITEAVIREVLRLDDAEGVDCLPNEEIFAELVRMGYEKPSTKLTIYKAFFSSQWKFLIHTILQSLSAKRTSGNEFSSAMTSAVICLSTGRKFNFSKYIFDSLEMILLLTEMMLKNHPYHLPLHLLPHHNHFKIFHQYPRRVEHLKYDKVAQALEITKLKRRVKKLEKGNRVKVLKLQMLKRVGTSQRIDTSEDTVMDDASNQGRIIDDLDKDDVVSLMDDKEEDKKEEEANVVEDDQVQGRQAESQAEIYKIDLNHASKVLSMQEDEPAEVQEVVDVVTTAKLITEVFTAASKTVTAASTIIYAAEPQVTAATITAAPVRVDAASTRRRKGVVIRDPEKESTTSSIIPADTKSKDKGKGIMVEEPKPLKKKQQVEMDEEYERKLHAELNKDIDCDTTIEHAEAQARKNMIMYLKNVAGFRLDYFKGMSYDDIRLIFEVKFNSNIEFLLKIKEQMEEEESRALHSINETPAQKVGKRRKLNEEVKDLKRHLEIVPDEDDDVYTEATPLARKNFDREDLEALWSLVKQRLSTSKPKNFFDDFLLTTLGAMFEEPDEQAQVWKNQRTIHGQAKVKSWKLLESYGVHIVIFSTTQLIWLVERRYPLSRFTLEQMLNTVRLRVEEESEMSLELLSAAKQKMMLLDSAAERSLMLLSQVKTVNDKCSSTLIDTEKPLLKDPDDQTVSGKDSSNPLMDDNLPKIVWYSTHHVALMKSWLVQKQTTLGVNTPRCDEDRLELMELMVFLLPSDEKVRVEVSVVDLQVSAVRLILLLLVQKFLLFGLTNWCCSLSAVSSFKYALTFNPNIYVSCIKQFWTFVAVKMVNDVMRLQALVDKKKVVITEASTRDALRLDDAEGIECLPNEEIFTELARMGYEKPSTKLTFYKAFFSSQWMFLIHTILQCMSANRTSWNEFSLSMAYAVIYLSTGRKFNFSKYIFDSLVRNVDSPTKFYMYPRFRQLIIRKQVGNLSSHSTKYTSPTLTQKVFANMRRVGKGFSGVDTPLFEGMLVAQEVGEDADEVHVKDVNVVGVAAEGVVSDADDVVPTADEEPSFYPIHHLLYHHNYLKIYLSLPKRVGHLELDKIAQALEITKMKQRVKKMERRNKLKVLKLRRLKRVGSAQRIDTSDDNFIDDVSKQGEIIANIDVDEDVVLEDAKDVAVENTTITAADVPIPAATTVAALILTAAPSKRRKGVVIRDPEETTTTSTIIHSEAKSKYKGKGILVEEPKPLKKQAQIEQDEKYARELEAELNKNIDWDKVIDHVQRKQKGNKAMKRYQALQRKPQTEAQARKNMMIYLRNVAGFKMDYFKGMTYDDIRLIFEKHFDSNVAFLQKNKEQMDLEALWSLVKERFATAKPKNFSDDFLLITLGAMFEKPDIHAKIWKNQRSVHGQAKVKSWKLLESCGVQIITFTTTQLILLVERRYPLTRFTLDQMLNNVRLEVEEESEVSLELLSYGVDVAMDFKKNMIKKMSRDVITVGSTMRIPLLYQGEYSQWRERFMNYLEEQTDEKVVVSLDSEGSGADDFNELKKITALLAKAFNRRKFYSKPINNNLRTSSTSQSANKKQEFVKTDDKKVEKKDDEKKRDESSSSAEETIAEVAYYTTESESESEFETSEYYDNSTNYGLFVNNNNDQEIFHDAIESASENFIENHNDSQKDYDKSEIDHNDSEEKEI
nr:hypothetical protein [Tanacetum cinerariifolium]